MKHILHFINFHSQLHCLSPLSHSLSLSSSNSPLQNFLFSLLILLSTLLSNCTFNKNQSRGSYSVQDHWWLFIVCWIFLVWCQVLNYAPSNTPSRSFALSSYLTLEITSYLSLFYVSLLLQIWKPLSSCWDSYLFHEFHSKSSLSS